MALPSKEIGRRIREVRETVGVSTSRIATALGVEPETVEKLEAGALDPLPGDYVLIIARLLHTDFRYFISNDVDDIEREARQIFRSLEHPSPDDLLAIRRFITFCMCESDLEELLSVRKPPLPPDYGSLRPTSRIYKEQGKDAARAERTRLGLGNAPIMNIFALIRSQGIRVFRHSLQDTNLSGVTILHPNAGVSVLLNYDDDLYRQFFSAAHEYGHVLFDRTELSREGCVVSYYRWDKRRLVEIRANSFAAEFLLPTDGLSHYTRPRNIEQLTSFIDQISHDYRINGVSVAIKLKEIGWITDRTLESFKKVRPVVVHQEEKTDPDIPGGLTTNQIDRRIAAIKEGITSYYLELLRRALTEDKITLGRFAEMLDMNREDALEFIKATRLAI